MISYLVKPDMEIVSFDYINKKYRAPIKSYGKHTIGKTPCAVLCNRYTASAGELFTAALRDYTDMGEMDAIIIGDVTYGKGVMQETQRLYDGSGITLTVAYYYPPGGKDAGYHGTGVTPDILTKNANEQDAYGVLEVVKKIIANDMELEGDATTDEAA
jgi:carboxyl-terminal processing protease